MNTIYIVLPILTLLMFELGIELNIKEFKSFIYNPNPIIVGLIGQIIILPIIAIFLGKLFHLEPLFFIGLVLISCSPGGSSSNIFSMLAKGDVTLSIILTTLSSIITLFTIPIIINISLQFINYGTYNIKLPVGQLIVQNILLMLLPILLGILFKYKANEKITKKVQKKLKKISFPALLFLITIFFIKHYKIILEHIGTLGLCILLLILLAMLSGFILSLIAKLKEKEKRTIIIEIGMQNAAQGIAIASSPFIFNNDIIAIPSILYSLLMNVVLIIYISKFIKH